MDYSQRDEVQASPVISTIMTNCSYELKGTTIYLYLTNSLQEDQLHRLTPRFMKYLRNELSNDLIELKAELRKEEEGAKTGNKLYTDADKLGHLLEEYPLFAELNDFLGLDLG